VSEAVIAPAPRTESVPPQFVVAMLGARLHYAVPCVLHAAGKLAHLFTDVCASKGVARALRALPKEILPATLRRLTERVPEGVPASRITAFTSFGIEYALRVRRARSASDLSEAFSWGGAQFCRRVLRGPMPPAQALFGYNSAALELLQYCRANALLGVMEQTIAPKRLEHRLLVEEAAAHPGWGDVASGDADAAYATREEAEWREADLILCGSEFVAKSIGDCGGPVERTLVVPYGVKAPGSPRERGRHDGPLRVLTLGQVGLRKGSPYVLEAARALGARAIFRLVGHLSVHSSVERVLRGRAEVVGPVPRGEVAQHLAWADVLLLPSICEGSATVCYEALAAGLPVVCTQNTGSPVRDGVDGFIVPVRDADAIAARVEQLAADDSLLETMSRNALAGSGELTIARYGERLLAALSRHQGGGA
jgi:hypothetical protein